MALFEPKFYYPKGEQAFQERVPWTDEECILLALENSVNLCGLDKKQVERIMKERYELYNDGKTKETSEGS